MNGLKQSLTAFWAERNQRERNMLMAAVTVVVLGLLYTLLIDPAVSGRKDLERRLPVLRQQAAEVQALSKEASAGGPKTAVPAPPPMTRESLEASLTHQGLKAQNLAVTGEIAKLQLNGASFSGMVSWLADIQRNARISVVDANVEAQAQADTVNATLTLRQQRGETAQ